MTSAVIQYIDDLTKRGGLKGADIATIAEVSKATVSRWSHGEANPQPKAQLVLSDLHYIVGRLEEFYKPGDVRDWLYARHPQLGGQRAIDFINANKTEEVITILDRLDAGAYL